MALNNSDHGHRRVAIAKIDETLPFYNKSFLVTTRLRASLTELREEESKENHIKKQKFKKRRIYLDDITKD